MAPLADLAITFLLPGDMPASFGITGRYARQTNYISPPGDFSAEAVMPVGRLTDDWYFVNGIDVLAPTETGGIVALGDLLTDANISTHDAFCRWPDQLARRLVARGGRAMGVMNQGLGGNRILHDIRGDSGLRRFDRDVLAQPGVTHAIVMLGTNDLRNRWAKPEEEVTAEQMIAGLKQMALRAHARGIRIFGCTLTPFEHETFLVGAWTPAREAVRQAVNAWIRDGGAFDAVVDFDKGVRDPEHPTRMLPVYDCGDHLHPSDAGYNRMGDVIDWRCSIRSDRHCEEANRRSNLHGAHWTGIAASHAPRDSVSSSFPGNRARHSVPASGTRRRDTSPSNTARTPRWLDSTPPESSASALENPPATAAGCTTRRHPDAAPC